jgi:hypothetical protein
MCLRGYTAVVAAAKPKSTTSRHSSVDPRVWAERVEPLITLAEVGYTTDGARSVTETSNLLCEKLVELMNCSAAAIRLPSDDGSRLTVVGLQHGPGLTAAQSRVMREEVLELDRLQGRAIRPGRLNPSVEAFLSGRPQVLPEIDTSWSGVHEQFPFTAMAAFPLIAGARGVGVLACYWTDSYDLSRADFARVEIATRLTCFALETARLVEVERRKVVDLTRQVEFWNHSTAELTSLAAAQRALADITASAQAPVVDRALQTLSTQISGECALVDPSGTVTSTTSGAVDDLPFRLPVQPATGEEYELRYSSERDPAIVNSLASFATVALATHLHHADRERDLSGALRPYLLLLLCSANLATIQLAAAGELLGVGDYHRISLLAIDCTDEQSAFRCSRELDQFSRRVDGVLAATSVRSRAVVLRHAEPDHFPAVLAVMRRYAGHQGVGCSGTFGGLNAVERNYRRAAIAGRLARARGRAIDFSEIGPLTEIMSALPPEQSQRIIGRTLGPLQKYDSENGTELLMTLATYIAVDGSPAKTAEQLHIHVNTAKQRLARIGEILQVDIRSYTTISRLAIAVEWHSFLEGGI